jgi:hypothetical protein
MKMESRGMGNKIKFIIWRMLAEKKKGAYQEGAGTLRHTLLKLVQMLTL